MGTAVMSVVRCQRGSSSASRIRYNLGNFLRTLATPETTDMTSLKEKFITIGAKVLSHCRVLIPVIRGMPVRNAGHQASCDFRISVHTP
jgi:hypothetical protein